MNCAGLIAAFIAFVAIGIGFVWVIRLEYFIGAHMAKPVAVAGILVCALSAVLPGFWLSAGVGIFGGTLLWGATELPEQARRVERGQFPANPLKKLNRS